MSQTDAHVDVVVVGAGVGGLACALDLAGRGHRVAVIERASEVGGKLRVARVGEHAIDCGPTVLTMRPVFEALFERAGLRLGEWLRLRPLPCLARHAWTDGSRLDLFDDVDRSADAIAAFAGAREAAGYRRFVQHGAAILERLEQPFLHHDNDGLLGVMRRVGLRGLPALSRVDFGRTMWTALADFFRDPRLRQLFARYATYYGSSPLQAPATLNLIAAVEQRGVWAVEGGMIALAQALRRAIEHRGGEVRCGHGVQSCELAGGRIRRVLLDDGTALVCDALVYNGDPSVLVAGRLGEGLRRAVPGVDPARPRPRSLSAMTWSMHGTAKGFPLAYHNVFFADDYEAEFAALARGEVPSQPTVYLCAQDRLTDAPVGPERLMCLVNAPALADGRTPEQESTCRVQMEQQLQRCGLRLTPRQPVVAATPQDFATRFPGTMGAIYGDATHGALAPFSRPRHATRIPNLWLVGGAIHPGAGLPMVTLGGCWVADTVSQRLASRPRSAPAATAGGTSTASPTTAALRSP